MPGDGIGGDAEPDFWAVGQKLQTGRYESKKTFDTTANSENLGVLVFDQLMLSISFLWGPPDAENSMSLYRNATLVQTFTVADFAIPTGSAEGIGAWTLLTRNTADDQR